MKTLIRKKNLNFHIWYRVPRIRRKAVRIYHICLSFICIDVNFRISVYNFHLFDFRNKSKGHYGVRCEKVLKQKSELMATHHSRISYSYFFSLEINEYMCKEKVYKRLSFSLWKKYIFGIKVLRLYIIIYKWKSLQL